MIIKEVLERAIETNRERDAVYKDGWRVQADILRALYPGGIPTAAPKDVERATFVFMIVAKLVRYVLACPHLDSVHDMGVYAFMLEQLDTGDQACTGCEKKELCDVPAK